jgi:hypothetical protein
MPAEVAHCRASSRRSRSLAARAGLARTFGGLASFIVLMFFCVGAYSLTDAIRHPIEAYSGAVLAGAFAISLSAILFFYLIKPSKESRSIGLQRSRDGASDVKHPRAEKANRVPSDGHGREDRIYALGMAGKYRSSRIAR